MARKRKNKPSKPRVMVAVSPANDDAAVAPAVIRERRQEAARLKAQGAEVNADKRTGEIRGAWRKDVFETLRNRRGKPEVKGQLGRPALPQRSYEAFRSHERDIHMAEGAGNPDRRPDFIRSTSGGAPGQNVTAEMLDAAERVRKTMRAMSPPDARLVSVLLTGENALAKNWRAVVEKETGEHQDEAQAARIRALGENLYYARSVANTEPASAANDTGERKPKEKPVTWFRGHDFG